MRTERLLLLALILSSFATLAFGQTPEATPPPPATPRSVAFPKPSEKILPNGLRVVVIQRSESPLVSAQLLVKNGGEVDQDLAGIADMTANLLTKGTQLRTATQIADEIEGMGGSLFASARWDASTATVEVLSSKIGPALGILADVVRRPTFKPDEVERLRQQNLDDITLELGDPGSLARLVAVRVVFGDSPYGHPLLGTPESLSKITPADIVKLHARYYRPDNAVLVLGGDITAAAGFALATRYFGDWPKPGSPLMTPGSSKSTGAKSSRVLVIDKPDAGQAAVYIAQLGISRRDPEYFRAIVANSVLSGYSGRLNQEIRIKRGLSYGAFSSLETPREAGPFLAASQTKNESGAEVAELLRSEVEKLSTTPPSESELTPRKAVLIGDFSRNLETAQGLVNQVASLALHGLSWDEINRYIDNVSAVTTADVQKFAGARLDAKTSSIIVVGNAKAFLPALEKRFGTVEVIPVGDLDLNSASLRKKE